MRNILGRKLDKVLVALVLFLFPLWLMATSFKVGVDKKKISRGENVTFTITAEGERIDFPTISSIDGFAILSTAQHSSVSIINGSVTKSLSKSYTFVPTKDVTIPSFKLKIDGKIYTTESIEIKVTKAPHLSFNGSDVAFTMSVDKHKVYTAEPIYLDLTLKYHKDKNFVDSQVGSLEFANFWIKQVGSIKESIEGNYIVKKVKYIIFPQKAGKFSIGPITAKLTQRIATNQPFNNDPFFNDNFFNAMFAKLRTKRIVSNSILIDVEPLPNNLELYGEFDISVTVDKKEVIANKPIKVGIRIDGYGNIDDIKKFELDIPEAVVYVDEPKIDSYIKDGRYGGTFIQTITVVTDSNFTIPALTLRFIDSKTNQPTEIKSKPIEISVKGKKRADTSISQPETIEKKSNLGSIELPQKKKLSLDWLMFIIGFIVGALSIFGMLRFRQNKTIKKSNKVRAIRFAKDDRTLFELLLPYIKDDPQIEVVIKKLEENLFKGTKHNIDKKLLVRIIEEIEENSTSKNYTKSKIS